MSFTDRYIRVPTSTNDEFNSIPILIMINPFDITYYAEREDEVEKELSKTEVMFRNGQSIVADMYLYEFEQLLNQQKHV